MYMKLSPTASHVVVLLTGFIIASSVYLVLTGEGYYSFGPVHVYRNGLASALALVVFGLLGRYWHVSIAPNTQGIQLFFGTQNGEVWNEGNFHFIPRPVWDIWKSMSVEHFVFTVAAQNRSSEGHQMMVLATGRAIPTDAYGLAKVSREDLTTQLIGLSMQTIAAYINREPRASLLGYPFHNLSTWFAYDHAHHDFNTYGVRVDLTTTKVVETNPKTMEQFDRLTSVKDMDTLVQGLKVSFPETSDVERYAIYATMVGIKPTVMTHIIKGGNGNIILDGHQDT